MCLLIPRLIKYHITQSHFGRQIGCSEICFSILFSITRSAKHLLSSPPIGVPPFCLKNPNSHSKYGFSVHSFASLNISSLVRSVLFCSSVSCWIFVCSNSNPSSTRTLPRVQSNRITTCQEVPLKSTFSNEFNELVSSIYCCLCLSCVRVKKFVEHLS